MSVYDIMAAASLFGVDSLTRWCQGHVTNTLTPRTAQGYLNDAADMSDSVPNKSSLLRPLLHWVGDNISTLRDRQLINNLDKRALILLGG